MITNDLQNRIHFGDRDAFYAIYREYGLGIYAAARKALPSDSLAKSAVKQTFLTLYEEILTKTEDFDIPVRLRELADHEVYILQLINGDASILENADPAKAMIEPDQLSARTFGEDADLMLNLPSLERDRNFRKPYKGLFLRKPERKNSGKPALIWKILLVLFDLFLIWFLLGLVMGLGILPAIDLGYTWFGRVLSSVTIHLS